MGTSSSKIDLKEINNKINQLNQQINEQKQFYIKNKSIDNYIKNIQYLECFAENSTFRRTRQKVVFSPKILGFAQTSDFFLELPNDGTCSFLFFTNLIILW